MGYETTFHIKGISSQVSNAIEEVSNYGLYEHSDKEYRVNDVKWYDHEKHLLEVSRNFPTVLITVDGWGEEDGDIWRKYFLNGQMQKATTEIVHSPCTLVKPHVFHSNVEVKILGECITVEVEHVGLKSTEELQRMAKDLIRNSI